MSEYAYRPEKLKVIIGRMQPKFDFWYFAGCLILEGYLKEPFSSAELAKAFERLGLEYSIKTYNYYPHKHSINYGERNVTQVFIAENRLYSGYYNASPYKLDQRKNYRLDREAFQEALEIRGWKPLKEEIEKEIEREEYGKFVDLLNELQGMGKISPEKRRNLDSQWRNFPQDRKRLFQYLKHMQR